MVESYYSSLDNRFKLLHGGGLTLLNKFNFSFSTIFADLPKFIYYRIFAHFILLVFLRQR